MAEDQKGVANSILIKVNQIGTLTETLDAMQKAKEAGYTAVLSHRSGETEIQRLLISLWHLMLDKIKTGAMSKTDRIAKYNELIRIEDEMGDVAQFPSGTSAFYNIKK